VAGQLDRDGAAPDRGEFVVADAGSQRDAQVAFVAAEQVVADLPSAVSRTRGSCGRPGPSLW
jgi:hypothetical protein